MNASSFGARRSGVFRSGGTGDANACRIVRRCTRNRFANAFTDRPSTRATRRISEYNSTLDPNWPSSLETFD